MPRAARRSSRRRAPEPTAGLPASWPPLPTHIARERPPPRQQRAVLPASRRCVDMGRRAAATVEQKQQRRQPYPQCDEPIFPPRERVALHLSPSTTSPLAAPSQKATSVPEETAPSSGIPGAIS